MDWIERHPEWSGGVTFAWLVLMITISAILRRSGKKPIFARPTKDALFVERWTSGRCLAPAWRAIGGAHNALMVAVRPSGGVIVHPHFPFSLGFLPEVWGLEAYPSAADIRDVEVRRGMLWSKHVRLQFRNGPKSFGCLELRLRDADGFIAALKRAGIRVDADPA